MKKILIVDDDPQARELLQRFFTTCGYETACAVDGLEGLKKAMSFLPDCVVLDLDMPKLGGMSLCSILKKDPKTTHIPILILTAEGRMGPAEDALNRGANGYLTKPVHLDRLKNKIESLLKQSFQQP